MGVGHLRDAQRGAMAQAQFLGDVQVMGHGQDTARSLDALLADDHCSIVQGTILEEDVLDEALIDVGIDDVTRAHHIIQRHVMLNDNEGAHLLPAHADAGHHDGHDVLVGDVSLLVARKEIDELLDVPVRTQRQQETAYLLLEEDDESQHTHADQLVEDGAQELHLQHLRHHQPDEDEHQDADEHIEGAGGLHQLVRVVQQQGHQQNVYEIFYTECEEHGRNKWLMVNDEWLMPNPAWPAPGGRPPRRDGHHARGGWRRPWSDREY